MALDKTRFLRQLIPKSYHFDGYNELNCPNSRDKPFFCDNVIPMGNHELNIRFNNSQTISLNFSSICGRGYITFDPYRLTIDEFAEMLKYAINNERDFITFPIQVHYSGTFIGCNRSCSTYNRDCAEIRKKNPKQLLAAVSFNPSEMQGALSAYYEINNKTSGGITMKTNKNLFGMNFELGISKDPNIKSTMLGVSVRNPENSSWYIFDQATGTRKNMNKMKFGDFPVILLPTKVLSVGDLIKMNNKYFYVKEAGYGQTIKIIGAADGEIREVYPEESFIPGLSMYTKVMAFDMKTLTDPVSKQGVGSNILAAMCMMQWGKGDKSEFSLDNISDNDFNGLGACLPLLLTTKDSNLGSIFTNPDGTPNLAMLLMLGGGNGNSDSDGMMQMLIMSQLLGGGNNATNIFDSITTGTPTVNTEDKMICPACGTKFADENVAFCTKCGTKTQKILPPGTYCKKCGTQLKEGAAFCHVCGEKAGPATCPNCGKPYDTGDAFCSGCGTSLKKPTPVAPAVEPIPAPAVEPTTVPVTPTTDAPATT